MSANLFDVVPEADESDPPGYGARTTRIAFKRGQTRTFSLPTRTARKAVVKVRFMR